MLLARVRIGDFDQFWSVFTTRGAEQRRKYGSTGAQAFRNQDDASEVLVVFSWSKEDYDRFLADPESKEIMTSAGLKRPPEVTELQALGETGS
jgi:heme-degrading monooxygenase HmoA